MATSRKGDRSGHLPPLRAEGHLRESYLRKALAKIAGVDGRTVQFYTDKGLITPEVAHPKGKGRKRLYSRKNLFEVLLIQELLRHGLTLAKMKMIIQKASSQWEDLCTESLEGKRATLVIFWQKAGDDASGGAYEVRLIGDEQFSLAVEMKDVDSILIVDISDIINPRVGE